MNLFNNNVLIIDDVFSLMRKPKDVTKDIFQNLLYYNSIININMFNLCLVDNDFAFESFVQTKIANSKSDVRRFMKNGSLMIGDTKITNIEQKIDESCFFNTGFDDVKWTSVRHGKKKVEFVFIIKDDIT